MDHIGQLHAGVTQSAHHRRPGVVVRVPEDHENASVLWSDGVRRADSPEYSKISGSRRMEPFRVRTNNNRGITR